MNKNYFKYIVFFLFFFFIVLFINLIINPLNIDEIWSYGFSYSISKGLVPYKDFNMVITPFYPFLMSFGLKIFGNSLLVFHIENTILVLLFLFVCFQLVKDKIYFIFPFLLFPIIIIFPNYNFLLLLLFVCLIYFEKKYQNDYLIGFFLALLFLTKQSVGISLFLVIFYYIKSRDKLIKRLIAFSIPIFIFFVYCIITNSWKSFFDLCFMGLLDFGKTNGSIITLSFFLTIFFVFLTITLIRKDSKKIEYYYLLMFASICIPLFDIYHFCIYFCSFLIIYFIHYDFPIHHKKLISCFFMIGILFVYISYANFDYRDYPNDLGAFRYRYLDKNHNQYTKKIIKSLEKYHHQVVFIGPDAYYFKIILNQKINFLDLINSGNFGYHGTDKLLKKIKELDSSFVFFVSTDELGYGKQTDQKVIQYILSHGKIIDRVGMYDIYRLGDEYDEMD